MGQLHDLKRSIDRVIAEKGLDEYKVRGEISLEVGFMLSLIGENALDDPHRIAVLREAASKYLGTSF